MAKRTVPEYIANKLDGLRKTDLRIQFFRSSGPGGQHRNKVETAVRITHKATGVTAEASDSRSQSDNRTAAFLRLVDKLIEHYRGEMCEQERKINSGWAEKIRTYHEPRNTVKDHRTGATHPYSDVIDGDLDPLIDASAECAVTE